MQDCKPISIPLSVNFKVFSSISLNNKAKRMKMFQVTYASTVESLMFVMICTRLNIAQVIRATNRYMAILLRRS
jgi:hypothetical protein